LLCRRDKEGDDIEGRKFIRQQIDATGIAGKNCMSEVTNNTDKHRFELAVDGHIAATYYDIADGVITFVHTEVPPELGGKGVGSKLIRSALDQVRADGLKVIPQCPFVKAFIEKHPDYRDLLK
jgi:uncharacterized protein